MRIILTIAAAVSIYAICTSAYAISTSDTEFVNIGDNRSAVHEKLGKGDKAGLKEIYTLSGGGELIAQYDNDVLVRGYIVGR